MDEVLVQNLRLLVYHCYFCSWSVEGDIPPLVPVTSCIKSLRFLCSHSEITELKCPDDLSYLSIRSPLLQIHDLAKDPSTDTDLNPCFFIFLFSYTNTLTFAPTFRGNSRDGSSWTQLYTSSQIEHWTCLNCRPHNACGYKRKVDLNVHNTNWNSGAL